MTITIADGRGALWQWDTGRRCKITDGDGVKQVHYQNKCFGRSVDVDVGDDSTAIIPDELLQDWHPLTAYAYVTDDAGGYTKVQVDFAVHKRARPSDYVYTPTEHAGFDRLRAEIGDLSALKTDAKDNLVAAINEAAASGGADWSQNDPAAKDYVKNRTHWVDDDGTVHKIPDKYIPRQRTFFEIKASTNGGDNGNGTFKVTADKSKQDVWDALERGEVPYVNFEDDIFLWPIQYAKYDNSVTFASSVPAYPANVSVIMVYIDGENSSGSKINLSTLILMPEQGNFGHWYIEGKSIENWYTRIKENPCSYPILCLYKGPFNIKYEYEGPLFLDTITDTEIVYKRTLEDGNWVGFKLSSIDGSPSKNGFIKGVSKEFVLSSSTVDSTKKFRITVDDSGALSAVEVTE